jgi:hypothetical protein
MIDPPQNWYPDPTSRHELRYWDGSRWTEHVSSAGVGGTDPVLTEPIAGIPAGQPGSASDGTGARSGARRPARHLGWVGLLLCVLAIFAVAVPGVGYARATADRGVRLDGSTQHILLPAHQKYGIYVDDADNSGYSEACSAVDAGGRSVRMADPSWSISSSDTEVLDLVFDTGSGALTINCSVPGERVTARPVPNAPAMLLGVILAGIVGCSGAVMIIAWFVFRIRRQRPT